MRGRGCVREKTLGNEKTEFAAHETAWRTSRQKVPGASEMDEETFGGKLLGGKI